MTATSHTMLHQRPLGTITLRRAPRVPFKDLPVLDSTTMSDQLPSKLEWFNRWMEWKKEHHAANATLQEERDDDWANKARLEIDERAKWARLRLESKLAVARTRIDVDAKRMLKSVEDRRAMMRQQRKRDKELARERAQEEGSVFAELAKTLLADKDQTGKTCCRNEQLIPPPTSVDFHSPSVGLSVFSNPPSLRSNTTPDSPVLSGYSGNSSAPQSKNPQALPAASERSRSHSRSAAPSPDSNYWDDLYTYMIGPRDIVLRYQALKESTEDSSFDYELDYFYLVDCPKSCSLCMPNITMGYYLAHLDEKHPRSDNTPWTQSDALIEGCHLIIDADDEWFFKERLSSEDSLKERESEVQKEPVQSSKTVDGKTYINLLEDGHGSFEHQTTNVQKRQREEDVEHAEVGTSICLKRSRTTGSGCHEAYRITPCADPIQGCN